MRLRTVRNDYDAAVLPLLATLSPATADRLLRLAISITPPDPAAAATCLVPAAAAGGQPADGRDALIAEVQAAGQDQPGRDAACRDSRMGGSCGWSGATPTSILQMFCAQSGWLSSAAEGWNHTRSRRWRSAL